MDVREKLIEILEEPCGGIYPACELADYLLPNGVTVQELDGCKFFKDYYTSYSQLITHRFMIKVHY